MNKEMDDFLSEGMKKYKKAAATMVSFGKEIEKRLQNILANRKTKGWGKFIPEETRIPRSTKYWSDYPEFNAKIEGTLGKANVRINIEINWYESEHEYPFYRAWLEPSDPYLKSISDFDWKDGVIQEGNGIRLYPREEDFNIERDFNFLLDELVRYFNSYIE